MGVRFIESDRRGPGVLLKERRGVIAEWLERTLEKMADLVRRRPGLFVGLAIRTVVGCRIAHVMCVLLTA